VNRLLIQAAIAAAIAGFSLAQLQQVPEVLAWEGLLLVLLIWQLREIPIRREDLAPRLFGGGHSVGKRLPRAVSSIELSMIDAMSGYLSPDRRVRPMLRRLAVHRLGRSGLQLDSPGAVERLGEENWQWLISTSDEVPDPGRIEDLVRQLEAL
jgi:hypothetical protein